MATDAQIAANIRNAQRSTGPITDEGKEVCRGNAFKHGLSSASRRIVSAELDFLERKRGWRATFEPDGEFQGWAFDDLVASSLRIDRCRRAIDDQVQYVSARSGAARTIDLDFEAAKVAARLAVDPVVTARKLRTTSEGCMLMIGRWNLLGRALAANAGWTDAERSAALDLMGIAPDLRAGATMLESDSPDVDLMAHRREIVRFEARQLLKRIEALGSSEGVARANESKGDSALLSTPVRLLLRYEREARRAFRLARRDLPGPVSDGLDDGFSDADLGLDLDTSDPMPEPDPEPAPRPPTPTPAPAPAPTPAPAPAPAPTTRRSPSAILKRNALLEALASESRSGRKVSYVDISACPTPAHPRL